MNERGWLTAQGAQARGQDMTPRELVVACTAAQAMAEDLGFDRLDALVHEDRDRERTIRWQQAYWRSLARQWRRLAVAGEQVGEAIR